MGVRARLWALEQDFGRSIVIQFSCEHKDFFKRTPLKNKYAQHGRSSEVLGAQAKFWALKCCTIVFLDFIFGQAIAQ